MRVSPQSAGLVNLSAALAAVLWATGAAAQDAVRGEALYETRCIGCHAVEANRVGPMHRGVFGRKAGAAAQYEYSAALKSSALIWDENTLDLWLADPEKTIPGQKMGYSVPDARDRADLIAYLRLHSKP